MGTRCVLLSGHPCSAFCRDPFLGVAEQAEYYLRISLNLSQHNCILDPIAMKIVPSILSIRGGKHKQAHDLCGFDVSESSRSLEEPMCVCFGGTDAKDCFYSALKGMSRSGVFYGNAGSAAFKKPWVCPDSLGFLLFSFSALES